MLYLWFTVQDLAKNQIFVAKGKKKQFKETYRFRFDNS